MDSISNGSARIARIYDAIAVVAADCGFDRGAVRRALFAAMLVDQLDISPADAAEMATEAATNDPQRTIVDNAYALCEEADKALQAVTDNWGDGGRFFNSKSNAPSDKPPL